MKSLFLGFLLLSSQLYASEALTTSSMDEAFAKVEEKSLQYGRENVLMVFDIDNTLLTTTTDLGSDQWFSWQEKIMKDPNIDTFRQKLKESKNVMKWIDIAAKWLQEEF